MQGSQACALTEAVYDAAVDPAGWSSVMAMLKRQYDSRAEAFYFLDYAKHTLQQIRINDISTAHRQSFPVCFYTDDNPCIRSAPLHRPGVVRTDTDLVEYFRDPQVLRRSTYYNEWMRPQDLAHTIGTTPLVEADVALNLSLLRPADRGPFSRGEVSAFRAFSEHLKRALRVALRLETLNQGVSLTAHVFDSLSHGVVVLDARGHILQCNAAAESLLRQKRGLWMQAGQLQAADARDRQRLGEAVRRCVRQPGAPLPGSLAHFAIAAPGTKAPLMISAVPLRSAPGLFSQSRTAVLIAITDASSGAAPAGIDASSRLHGFTPAEARLAKALVAHSSLRPAAGDAGMSYETARWFLKILFQKTGTRRQADLIRLLVAEGVSPLR